VSSLWTKLFGQDHGKEVGEINYYLGLVKSTNPSLVESWVNDVDCLSIPAICFVWGLAGFGILSGLQQTKAITSFAKWTHPEVSWRSFKLCEEYIRSRVEFKDEFRKLLELNGDTASKDIEDCYYSSLTVALSFTEEIQGLQDNSDITAVTMNFFAKNEAAAGLVTGNSLRKAVAGSCSLRVYVEAVKTARASG
jgi:hypothetical protein